MPLLAGCLERGEPLEQVPGLRLHRPDGWLSTPRLRNARHWIWYRCLPVIWSNSTARLPLPAVQAGLADRDRPWLSPPLFFLLGLAAL